MLSGDRPHVLSCAPCLCGWGQYWISWYLLAHHLALCVASMCVTAPFSKSQDPRGSLLRPPCQPGVCKPRKGNALSTKMMVLSPRTAYDRHVRLHRISSSILESKGPPETALLHLLHSSITSTGDGVALLRTNQVSLNPHN